MCLLQWTFKIRPWLLVHFWAGFQMLLLTYMAAYTKPSLLPEEPAHSLSGWILQAPVLALGKPPGYAQLSALRCACMHFRGWMLVREAVSARQWRPVVEKQGMNISGTHTHRVICKLVKSNFPWFLCIGYFSVVGTAILSTWLNTLEGVFQHC